MKLVEGMYIIHNHRWFLIFQKFFLSSNYRNNFLMCFIHYDVPAYWGKITLTTVKVRGQFISSGTSTEITSWSVHTLCYTSTWWQLSSAFILVWKYKVLNKRSICQILYENPSHQQYYSIINITSLNNFTYFYTPWCFS